MLKIGYRVHKILKLKPFALIALFVISGCAQYDSALQTLESIEPDTFTCTALEVKSADTFLCQFPGLDIETIRLAGISVPADKASEAKRLSRRVLTRGTLINIEPVKDSRNIDRGLPAYVWVPGGHMLNIVLVERGYAQVLDDEVIKKYEASFIKAGSNSSTEETEVIEEVEIKKEPWRK